MGPRVAATVDSHTISQDKVTELLDSQRRYLESIGDQPGADPQQSIAALANLLGSGVDTYSMAEASGALELWINYTIVLADLKRAGESVTAEDREAARADIAEQNGGEASLEAVDPVLLNFSINSGAALRALQRVVDQMPVEDAEARKRALYEEIRVTQPLCLNIIVSDTEENAAAALARVEGGDDFATVASEESIDAGSAAGGGFAGCASPDQAASAFPGDYSTVAVGELLGPISVQDVFVVVEVGSTTGPTYEEAEPQLAQQVATEDTGRLTEYRAELLAKADVTVDPRFGSWDPVAAVVNPPV